MDTDADRAQKHGMDEFISANPCSFDHSSLFEMVQRLTLDHRLNDSYSCLVFVMDEYCARNGVRGCHRHLCYLGDLLERAENGAMIDPTLLHYSFAFCASHVLMKDIVTPVPQEEVKTVIRKCLEQAALINYQRLSEYAKVEGKKREMYEHPVFCLASQVMDLTIPEKTQKDKKDQKDQDPENVGRLVTPAKKLEDTIRLAELVIEVLQQNEEHHAEVSTVHIHESKVSYYQSRELRTTENHVAFILSLTLFNRLQSQSVQYLHQFFLPPYLTGACYPDRIGLHGIVWEDNVEQCTYYPNFFPYTCFQPILESCASACAAQKVAFGEKASSTSTVAVSLSIILRSLPLKYPPTTSLRPSPLGMVQFYLSIPTATANSGPILSVKGLICGAVCLGKAV
ncbi:unnamed protein product [Coregonus sp. 'balchen']|nr:unnamed protein product [Coregonus sp. 'balchen']